MGWVARPDAGLLDVLLGLAGFGRGPPCVVCGRPGRWCVCGCGQAQPWMLPRPVLGQVDRDASGVAGDASARLIRCQRMVAGRAVA